MNDEVDAAASFLIEAVLTLDARGLLELIAEGWMLWSSREVAA
jgi:hypothetical protein